LAASKDGTKLVSGSQDKTVVVWMYNGNKSDRLLEPEKWFSHSDAI